MNWNEGTEEWRWARLSRAVRDASGTANEVVGSVVFFLLFFLQQQRVQIMLSIRANKYHFYWMGWDKLCDDPLAGHEIYLLIKLMEDVIGHPCQGQSEDDNWLMQR